MRKLKWQAKDIWGNDIGTHELTVIASTGYSYGSVKEGE